MWANYTYLIIDIASISIPLAWSFEYKVNFVRYWKPLFISMIITAFVFIPWDIAFTFHGNWGFNEKYLTGIYLWGLPIEEILFFFCIPYASVFTHEALKYYIPYNALKKHTLTISTVLLILFTVLLALNYDKQYTASATALAIIEIIIFQFWLKSPDLGRIYLSFLFVLIPFFVVNGLLTGTMISEEVVWYNNTENLAMRMGTIPIEDAIYAFALLVLNMQLFEYFKRNKALWLR